LNDPINFIDPTGLESIVGGGDGLMSVQIGAGKGFITGELKVQ